MNITDRNPATVLFRPLIVWFLDISVFAVLNWSFSSFLFWIVPPLCVLSYLSRLLISSSAALCSHICFLSHDYLSVCSWLRSNYKLNSDFFFSHSELQVTCMWPHPSSHTACAHCYFLANLFISPKTLVWRMLVLERMETVGQLYVMISPLMTLTALLHYCSVLCSTQRACA